jgi:CRP/FNR family cyclic AMP-dependent transcriptional regulator
MYKEGLMHIGELVGYLASALVFATFYMKTMIPLRNVAIVSNVAFISYGYLGGMAPILILHVALLPPNLWRLHQTRQLVKRVRLATEGDLNLDWLMPHMTARNFAAGETIFRKGDSARELFLITAGTVRLTELGVEVGRGSMVGEIGVFSPYKTRIATAVAVTHVELLAIAEDRVITLYNDHREFGFYMVSLITKRLVADFEELERRVAATKPSATAVNPGLSSC